MLSLYHMTLQSIFLGIIQGLTEFLPISSSGHLIVFRDIFNLQFEYGLAYDAVLQLATTLAILVYFRKDICNLVKKFFVMIKGGEKDPTLLAVIIGTIPAIILGLLLEEYMDTVFRSSELVALTLFLGGLVMLLTERFAKQDGEISMKKGLVIGLFQSLALIPGMSRSGMTIAGGLFAGITREAATRFSFILAFPILLGSGLKKLYDLNSDGLLNVIGVDLFWGSLSAFIVGLIAIHFLIKFLKNNSLKVFVWYRWVVALLIVLFI